MEYYRRLILTLIALFSLSTVSQASDTLEVLDSISSIGLGVDLFEDDIDNVIFATNEFLTDATFIGDNGPFWMIMQVCMCLGALFALIMAAGMAYKMMVKGEPFDVLKILRALGIATVMMCWYGNPIAGMRGMSAGWDGTTGRSEYIFDGGVLDMLAYIPNCIGSYTHDLYEIEALNVKDRVKELTPKLKERDNLQLKQQSTSASSDQNINNPESADVSLNISDVKQTTDTQQQAKKQFIQDTYVGVLIAFDKIVLFFSFVIYRIGWWGTIFIQQIMLGALTIFGPIQWACSLLPKWEGAWAKWLTRYLTVHFYGAMLYFVGFYVLLLFDIVISIQIDQLAQITQNGENYVAYTKDFFLTSGYLLVAAVVALKCLNLVPDLAAWMIPEGDTGFAARNFGEGVAQGAKNGAMSIMR
jgi:hypothetical protein